MHQNPKWKIFVKYIRAKIVYKKYQINLVDLFNELNKKEKYQYLLHELTISLSMRELFLLRITIRNSSKSILKVLIRGYPKEIQTDYANDFVNKLLN